ncbi:hypothetical protein ACFFGH_34225 [Lysobacter korlensis]|uniref:Uncharacterized protein n=1 Tax=Lysobacter korlensis TaxID=553636 RepID=A0ABV6S461_9GAMM
MQSDGTAILYLGEVSTAECLSTFSAEAAVELLELGAESHGEWLSAGALPEAATVAWWLQRLDDPSLELVDFSSRVGAISLSTHDDGEATFALASLEQAVGLLPQLVGDQLAATIAPKLVANPGCYISARGGQLAVHPSFEAYLVGA